MGADWVSGKLGGHNIPKLGEKFGLTSSSGDLGLFSDLGYDIQAFVRAETGLTDWTQSGSNLGTIMQEVTVGDDTTVSLAWSMYTNSNGSQSGPYDTTVAMLFRDNGDGTFTLVESKFLDFAQFDKKGVPSPAHGTVSWDVEDGGKYVIVMAVVEADGSSGQKTVLTVDGAGYVTDGETIWIPPVTEEQPSYTVHGEGNVIGDAFAKDAQWNAGEEHDNLVDHHSEGKEFWVTEFKLNGEWYQADGKEITWTDDDGTAHSFWMKSDGSYEYDVTGPGSYENHSIGALDVHYKVASEDNLTAEADLYLRDPADIHQLADGGVTYHGVGGDEVIYGGSGDDVIYGGLGNDVMYGGGGKDTFAWAEDHYDGSTDVIKDFSLADGDHLRLEGFLDNMDDLGSLLTSRALSALIDADAGLLRLTVDDGAKHLTIDVNFEGSELKDFVTDYIANHGSDDGVQQALLQQMIQTVAG